MVNNLLRKERGKTKKEEKSDGRRTGMPYIVPVWLERSETHQNPSCFFSGEEAAIGRIYTADSHTAGSYGDKEPVGLRKIVTERRDR